MGALIETYYQCDVCKAVSPWTENHRHIERAVGHGPGSWEVVFVTCSEKCRVPKRIKVPFIKWLSGFPRWGQKSAERNFEEVFLSRQSS